MSSLGKKTVFLVITHGTHAKLFLQNPCLDYLLENTNIDIVLFSPSAEEDHFIEKYGKKVTLIKTQIQGGLVWSRFNNIRRFLIAGKISETKKILINAYKHEKPIYHFIVSVFNFFFRNFKYSKNIFSLLDRIIFRDKYYKQYFDKYKPDAVILLSTVHNESHYIFQRAYIEKVKTIHIVESWDNPSAKLESLQIPDYSIVWNKTMCDELNEFLGIDKNRIFITGSPFHDIAADKGKLSSKEEVAERYGMDPKYSWIVIASTLNYLFPDFNFFLKSLDKLRIEKSFKKDFQILIRPHPQAISGYSVGDGIDELKKIKEKYNYIYFDVPKVIESKLPVYMDKKDISNYADILNVSDVVISFFSSATIDAAALNTPVILPAFENIEKKSFFPTMKQRIKFTHHSKLISTGGVSVAYNYVDLIEEINKYLLDNDEKIEMRKELVNFECGVIDGSSYKRTVDAIVDIIEEKFENIDQNQGHQYY